MTPESPHLDSASRERHDDASRGAAESEGPASSLLDGAWEKMEPTAGVEPATYALRRRKKP